ncbi:MAG: hypothetical protein ACYSUQ_03105 [Planctomycetota bacterium]|jgi:hypothetical protein
MIRSSKGPVTVVTLTAAVNWLGAPPAPAHPCDTSGDGFVKVIADMNPSIAGCQDFLLVPVGTTVVDGLAIHIFDPAGTAQVWDIGYVGGINRGISFGHVPSNRAVGTVSAVLGTAGVAVNPTNTGWVEPGYVPLFAGPEVQYVESSLGSAAPAPIPTDPAEPVFEVTVELNGAQQGDEFRFFLGDMVTLWYPGHGSFSTRGSLSLDTGGDVGPDGTVTLYGVDADAPLPVPPAAYSVDFVDGDGGARIMVVVFGDGDFDGDIDLKDFAAFQACFAPGEGPAPLPCAIHDLDGDGDVDLDDYVEFYSGLTGARIAIRGLRRGGRVGEEGDLQLPPRRWLLD